LNVFCGQEETIRRKNPIKEKLINYIKTKWW